MAEYIDRDKAIETIQETVEPYVIVDPETTCIVGAGVKEADVIKVLNGLTAADVQEVRYGEWLEDEHKAEYCSKCGKHPYNDGEYYIAGWWSEFCPHCGVKMKG